MLETTRFLRENGMDWSLLESRFGISVTKSPCGNMMKLSYSQIDSPKTEPIVMECRGLILYAEDAFPVAVPFDRFFNFGEALEITSQFVWGDSVAAFEKVDGSLSILAFDHRHSNEWFFTTRGSFAEGELIPGKSWKEMMWAAAPPKRKIENVLDQKVTYIFEYCSPYNKVVRDYREPIMYLLAARHNETLVEFSDEELDALALELGVLRPERYVITSPSEADKFILDRSEGDATWEGLVCKDVNGLRVKIKSPKYLSLHHMKDNGNIFLPKNLISFVLAAERDELVVYFPEVGPYYDKLMDWTEKQFTSLVSVMESAKTLESQKDFALYITKEVPTPFASLLFRLKAEGKLNVPDLRDMWISSKDLIVKVLDREGFSYDL